MPVLETARLILRPPEAGDLDGWAAMMADDEAARWIGGVQTRHGAWRGLATMVGHWGMHGFGMFSVLDKATGQWLGRVGPLYPEGWPGREIGWGLRREAWGQGYAREAATAAMDWTFGTLGWAEVIHVIHPSNARSAALAARLSSRRLGTGRLPPPFHAAELDIWGQDAAAWRASRASSATDA